MTTTALRRGAISVVDYRCTAGPGDTPYPELYHGFSISYVRRGSFGYRYRGAAYHLVTGSGWSAIRATSSRAPTSTSPATSACR